MTGVWPWARRILVAFILFWGTLALLARFATPLLENVREPIAAWLSEQAGVPIEIGRLRASWYGIGPRLRLQRVAIGSPVNPVTLREIAFDLVPAGLLSEDPFSALRLTVDGLQLQVQREPGGQVRVTGLPRLKNTDVVGEQRLLPLPSRLRLRNTRLYWHDLYAKAKPVTVDDLMLDLQRDGSHLRLRAELHSSLGNAEFAADVEGYLMTTEWSGSSYLRVDNIQLANLLQAYIPSHYRVEEGLLDLELWQQWQDAVPVDLRGSLALRHASLANTAEQPRRVKLERLAGDYHFVRDARGWLLQLDRLLVTPADRAAWPPGRVAVRGYARDGGKWIEAAADNLVVGDLVDLLLIRAPSATLHEALVQLQPQGMLSNLRLQWPLDGKADWAFSSDFKQLAVAPWRYIPGVSNLAGGLAATPTHASLRLNAEAVPVNYGQLFRHPLQLDQLQGVLHWTRGPEHWEVRSQRLAADTPDFRSNTRFLLRQANEQPVHLDLISDLFDGDVASVSKYLPATIMSQKLVRWLDQSLSQGRVEHATALISGPLATFPYHKSRNGTFEVVALTRDTPLDYQQGWPPLEDVSARLEFHENSLDITLLEGRIYNSTIEQARATINSLEPTSPLQMKGRLRGPLEDEIRVLREDALRKEFGHIAETLQVGGNAELRLDFAVPLVDGRGDYRLDGSLFFNNASLNLPDWNLDITQVNGELGISLDALRASGIRGEAFGRPVQVDVTPMPDGDTRVSARTHLDNDALARQLPQLTAPLRQLLDGEAEFSIELDVPGISAAPDAPTILSVASSLEGMRLDLPPPLTKAPEERKELLVSMPVAGEPRPTFFRLGSRLSAAFSPDWQSGEIRYQRGKATPPGAPGYQLHARLEYLDLDAWQQTLGPYASHQGAQPDWLAEIHSERLLLGGLSLDDAKLEVQARTGALQGTVASRQLEGNFSYPAGNTQPLDMQLQRFHLQFPTDEEGDPEPPAPALTPDPRSLPPIQLACKDLQLNDASLGTLELRTQPASQGLEIVRLSIDGPSGQLEASGTWDWQEDTQYSRLTGTAALPDLGKTLRMLGYPRSLQEASAQGSFDLSWPGHPGQFHHASFHGTADIDISKGRLAEVEPGITRVLGLLNLDALTRRLKLDFGDLVKKGYSFDSIAGSFRFEDGDAYTHDLLVEGASGRIEVGGRIGLVDRDFDQLVNVTPNLDATLPIAGTVAGGPVAGLATLVLQELMAEEVDRLNRFEYSVDGSWEDPVLTPLDSSGVLPRLINTLTGKQEEAKTSEQEGLIQRSESASGNPLQRLLDNLPKKQPESDSLPANPAAEFE